MSNHKLLNNFIKEYICKWQIKVIIIILLNIIENYYDKLKIILNQPKVLGKIEAIIYFFINFI